MTGQPYQVMPPLAEPEYDALKASIAAGYDPARPVVVEETMQAALSVGDYYTAHALAAFDHMGTDQAVEDARGTSH